MDHQIKEEYKELAIEFIQWYANAQPGQRFVYYYGVHLHETIGSNYLKKIVWDYACDGKIYIFQARDMLNVRYFNFIAVKSKHRLERLIPYKEVKEAKNARKPANDSY